MTDTTPTKVATPMMMPRRVRKLRRGWERIARRASSRSSRGSMIWLFGAGGASGNPPPLPLLRLGGADGVVGLERAERLERPGDEPLAPLEPGEDLDRELAGEAGPDGLEARLAILQEVDPLLVARRPGGRGRLAAAG